MADDQDQIKENYGKPLPHDKDFEGPNWRKRRCTDVPCLLIFIIFLVAWAFIAHYAIKHGDLNKIMVPTDSFNRKCGLDSQVLDKKFLFFFDFDKCIDPVVPLTGCPTEQVCVNKCPTETFEWETMKNTLTFPELKNRLICLTDAVKNNIRNKDEAAKAIQDNLCAKYYVKSTPVLNRCIWESSAELCEYVPSMISRKSRDAIYNGTGRTIPQNNVDLAVLTLRLRKMLAFAPKKEQKLVEEPKMQCRRETETQETIIKEKIRKFDTRISKFIGNMMSFVYNNTQDTQEFGEAIVEDIFTSYYIILTGLLLTLLASFIFVVLLRWLACPIIWTSIIALLIGMVFLTVCSVRQYKYWKNTPTVPNHALNLKDEFKNILQEPNTWLCISIAVGVLFVIILLIVIVLRKRIRIAIALTEEGSKAISCVRSTIFFPILSWILYVMVIVYAIAVGLYLGTIGKETFRMVRQLNESIPQENCICEGEANMYKLGESCVPAIFEKNCFIQYQRTPCLQTSCSFVEIETSNMIKSFFGYNIFGFFWLMFFISAFNDMVLAATFATWYWTPNNKSVPFFALPRAFAQTLIYNLGTLAFGSLILAICRIIRVIIEYIQQKVKKYDNAVTRSIICCCRCFFWLLETFLRFLNRNAYIMCAIHGKGFCASAKDSLNLVMRNFLRLVALDKVTDFIFFLSKLFLTAAAGVSSYYYCANNLKDNQLHYNAVPTTLVVIGAFLITSVIFGVYSIAVDTLFLCFLEDLERNDGTPQKKYCMSKSLMAILNKRNKKPKSNENQS